MHLDDSLEGFELLHEESEPYSPSNSEDDFDFADSISSISDASARPVLGGDYDTSDEDRDAEVAGPIVGEELAQALEPQIASTVFRHVVSGWKTCHKEL